MTIRLIMPVYRGDQFWLRAMESLQDVRELFDRVVISFDGPQRAQLADGLRADPRSLPLDVLVTPWEMTAAEHAVWIMHQSPVQEWPDHQWVMFMAEDDILCHRALSAALEALVKTPRAILFGRWADTNSSRAADFSEDASKPRGIDVFPAQRMARRLVEIAANDEITSVSGITMPTGQLRNYFRQLQGRDAARPLLHGFRTEYFLATQPGIEVMIESLTPVALVQQHGNQERVNTPSRAMNSDEACYQLWLMMTGQPIRPVDRMFAGMRLVKRIGMDPSVLHSLWNAFLTFRSTRRAV